MSDIAIRVENLSKLYHIGALQQRHDTLRDALTGVLPRIGRISRNQTTNSKNSHNSRQDSASDDTNLWALKDVSFEVKRGEVVGIIGRNGAGKSTLLKILSRITEPTSGHAEIHGRVGSLLEVGTGFHPELTGRENIFLNGAILGMRRSEIDRQFDAIVAFAEIERFLDTPVKRYSSGMYVRLAFAVAAHLEPEILLVDEVLAVGDAQFQKKCLGKMGDVAKEGRTVLFVSHNMSAVLNLCSWGVLVESGLVTFKGKIDEVVDGYLRSHGTQVFGYADVSSHPGRPLRSVSVIKSVGLRTAKEGSEYVGTVKTGDDLIFEVNYDCGEKTIDLFQIGISSLSGQRIFTVGNHHCSDSSLVLAPRGVIKCYLPRVMLAEGEYAVTVMLGKRIPPHNVDIVENAMFFRMEFNNYFGTGFGPLPAQGIFVQRSVWDIEPEIQ